MSPRKITGLLATLAGLLLMAPPVSYALFVYGLTTMCLTGNDIERLRLFGVAGVLCLALGLWALFGSQTAKVRDNPRGGPG